MKVDVLIKNGRVMDPARNLDAISDIAIYAGQIVDINKDGEITAGLTVDATGCLVVPGLVDAHQHINYHGADWGMHPDLGTIPYGVTCVADAGTSGYSNCLALLDKLAGCAVKSKIYVNVSPLGQATGQYPEPYYPEKWEIGKFRNILNRKGDKVAGLKMRLSKGIVEDMKPLDAMQKLAIELGLRVLVHPTNAPVHQREILNRLKPGDIYCHVYQGRGNTILDENGKLIPEVFEARKRGVILDSAHGMINFDFDVARAAFDQGLLPDVISSDTTLTNFGHKPMHNILEIMSKFLYLGMPEADIIRRVTDNPARVLDLPNLYGTLLPGAPGDVAILKVVDEPLSVVDCEKKMRVLPRYFCCQATWADGQLLYQAPGFAGC